MIKPSPFIKEIAFTMLTSVLTAGCGILTIHILAQELGSEGFGVYALARQVFVTISPLSTFAMGVAIVRFIATSDHNTKFNYLISGLLLGFIPCGFIFILGAIFKNQVTFFIFRNEAYSSVLIATLFLVLCYSLYAVLYAFYRGSGCMAKANIWQLGVVAIGPLLIAKISSRTGKIDLILFLTGLFYFCAFFPLVFYCIKGFLYQRETFGIRPYLNDLFRYGSPRMIGGIALTGILAVGPFFAPYFGSIKEAGYLIVGQSIFALVETGVSAFGLVVLPKATQYFVEGKKEFLKGRITDTVVLVVHIGLFLTLHLMLWSDQIVTVWLGHDYIDAIPLMRILLIALISYLLYVMLRSFIDAIEKKAINTLNLYISLIVTIVISFFLANIGFGVTGIAIGTMIGFLVLGFCTVIYLWKANWMNKPALRLNTCIVLNSAVLMIAGAIKYAFQFRVNNVTLLVMATVLEVFLFLFYIFLFRKLRVGWMLELEGRITR